MVKQFIGILILLTSTFALSIVYREDAPLRLLVVELIFITLILIAAILNAMFVKYKGYHTPAAISIGKKGEDKKNIIVMFTGGIFFMPVKGKLKLSVRNVKIEGSEKIVEIPFYLCRGHSRISFPVKFSSAGLIEIKPISFRIFEATGLIGIKKTINADKKKILVFPECYSINVNNAMHGKSYQLGTEESEYHSDHPGDDPSEIFDHREFRPGDKMSRVNWKLSVREGALMVKELSDPIREPICIVMGLNTNSVSNSNEGLSLLYSLAEALRIRDIRFSFLIHTREKKLFELAHVKDSESMDEAMTYLMSSDTVLFSEVPFLIDDELMQPFSQIYYITAYDLKEINNILEADDSRKLRIFAVGNDKGSMDDRVFCFNIDRIKNDISELWLDIN